MTWLEKEVPNLELCKQLKELGYPQGGDGFCWIGGEFALRIGDVYHRRIRGRNIIRSDVFYTIAPIKIPTLQELGKWLPLSIMVEGTKFIRVIDLHFVAYVSSDMKQYAVIVRDETESNARIKMVIWLKQHGYIDFKKEA